MHVEDHPLDYASFEGDIPAGEYGAGTVEIWDRGTYELLEEKRDGGLTVHLRGERVDGVWTLVPARLDGDERNWLLLRKDNRRKRRGGRSARARDRDGGPADGRWLALRAQVGRLPRDRDVRGGQATLTSRTVTTSPSASERSRAQWAHAVRTPSAVLDAEVCALDESGTARFGRSRRAPGGSSSWSSTCSCSTTSRSTCAR